MPITPDLKHNSSFSAPAARAEASPALAEVCLTPTPGKIREWCDAVKQTCRMYTVLHDGRIGTKTDELLALLKKTPPAERGLVEAMYREHFGLDLADDLKSHLYGRSEEAALKLLKEFSPAQSSSKSFSTERERRADNELPVSRLVNELFRKLSDERFPDAQVIDILKNKTPEQIQRISRLMEKRHHASLEAVVAKRLSGRSRMRVLQVLEGPPPNPQAFLDQVKQNVDFERSGVAGWITWRLSLCAKRLRRHLAKAEQGLASSEEKSRDELTRARFAAQDLVAFVQRKDRNAAIVAAITSAVSTVGVMTVMSAAAPVWAAAGAAALAGTLCYTAGKIAALGRAYDRRSLLRDTALGAIEAGVTVAFSLPGAITQAAARKAGEQTVQRMLEQSVKKGASGVIQDLTGGLVVRSGVSSGIGSAFGAILIRLFKRSTWELGVEAALTNLTQAALSTAITSTTGSAAKNAIKEIAALAPPASSAPDYHDAYVDLMMDGD